tara:strand:+ start:61 stop:315 length:255 start_codon:yes stop_codon:yes gene_type:complete
MVVRNGEYLLENTKAEAQPMAAKKLGAPPVLAPTESVSVIFVCELNDLNLRIEESLKWNLEGNYFHENWLFCVHLRQNSLYWLP